MAGEQAMTLLSAFTEGWMIRRMLHLPNTSIKRRKGAHGRRHKVMESVLSAKERCRLMMLRD
jgi:hypothetical protein